MGERGNRVPYSDQSHSHAYSNAGTAEHSLWVKPRTAQHILAFSLFALLASPGYATVRDQAKRIHERLTGIPPTNQALERIVTKINSQNKVEAAKAILNNTDGHYAEGSKNFYNVTLKNLVTPWTNEEQTVFAPLNDYTATVIGMIRDDEDFRKVLYDDIIYTGTITPAYNGSSNAHYEALETQDIDLSKNTNLVRQNQSVVFGLTTNATAGIMTSRAAASAFFIDGTNRAMFRFTLLNHLCYDLEQLKDNTRPTDRIRQDVSRSPGGDSRIFINNCSGCHTGMDPMAQAFAYYDYNESTGRLVYSENSVQAKYHINDETFPYGFRTPDDNWSNYWRRGANSWLGWGTSSVNPITIDTVTGFSHGKGAKSLGEELANSDAFARCQVKKVFKTVCLREPQVAPADPGKTVNRDDTTKFEALLTSFKSSGYKMKNLFAETAASCSGDED